MTKKLTVLFALVAMAVGVSSCDKQDKKPESKYWHVIKIDSCEYIESSRWNNIPLIHKANCNNPIHKLQK